MNVRGQGGPGNGWNACVKWLARATRRWYLGLALIGPGLAVADELPPPPTEAAAIADATLYLDLLVNQVPRAELVPVQQRAGGLFLDSQVLRAAGIALPGNPQGEVALDAIAGLHSDYDSQNQRLLLQVPPAWLPDQQVGDRNLYPASDARSSFGALFNYDLYLNDTDEGVLTWQPGMSCACSTVGAHLPPPASGGSRSTVLRPTTAVRAFCATTPPGASPTSSAC